MINPVSALSRADSAFDHPAAEPPRPQVIREAAPAKPEAEPSVRLTIDASPDGPFFVYTLQDRETGRIIAQLPRHAAAKLAESPDYHAGDLISASA